MLKPQLTHRSVLIVVLAGLVLWFAVPAAADTIYLKNGRIIRTSQVRVEGDRVFFIQYGGEVAMPMALVDRIVEDANIEPEAAPAPPPAPARNPGANPAEPADPEGADAPVDTNTRAHWQGRVRTIEAEKSQVELQIEDLRREERAFLFSKRSTAQTRQKIDDAQERLAELEQEMTDLRAEARREGIPVGWLRLPVRERGG